MLEPAATRELMMRDAAGKPVSGARVAPRIVETELTGFMGIAIPDLWIDRFAANTDAEGVALVACLSRRTELRGVSATITGKGQHVLQLPYEQGKEDTTLVLGRLARLTGEIKSATGAPIAEAIANGDDAAKSWSLSVLRWLDPAELLERAQKTRFKSGTRSD